MKQKITRHLDRIIMGAIIGAAIGSVLGIKFAKKKQSPDGAGKTTDKNMENQQSSKK